MKYIIITLIFSINMHAFGQEDITYHKAPNTEKNEPQKTEQKNYLEHISVGGTAGVQFGYRTFFIEVSPHAAYHFNDYFSAGVGGSYLYFNDKSQNYSTHVFGPKVFAEAHFLKYLGVHAAYQAFNYEVWLSPFEKQRIWSNNICVGGGYYQRVGRLVTYFYALYNFTDRPENNIYSSPLFFNAGFSFFLK